MNYEKFLICDKIIWKAAHSIFKKIPNSVVHYAFGEVEDAYQQGWVCIYKNQKVKDIVKKIKNKDDGGLLYTVVYYDLYDHVRSVCGRENISVKNKTITNLVYSSGNHYPIDSDPFEKNDKKILNSERKRMFLSFDSSRLFDGTLYNFNFTLSKQIIRFLNEKLTERELKIARELFFEENTQEELAKKYKISASRMGQIKKKIINTAFRFENKKIET